MPLTPTTTAPSSGVPVTFSAATATLDGGYRPAGVFVSGTATSITANNEVRRIYILTGNRILQYEDPELNPASSFFDGVSVTLPGVPVLRDFSFNHDGSQIIVSDSNTFTIFQLTLSTPYDIGTAVVTSSLSVFADTELGGIAYGNPDASGVFQSFYVIYDSPPFGDFFVYRFDLSDPADVSTGTEIESENISTPQPYNMWFNETGYSCFVNSMNGTSFFESTMSAAWDITSLAGADSATFGSFTAIGFGVGGLRLYTARANSGKRTYAYISSYLRPTG